MKFRACITIGVIATLLLVISIGTAEEAVFSNETNSTFDVGNLSLAVNISLESTSLCEESITLIQENENVSYGNGDGTSTLIGLNEMDIELQVVKTTRVSIRTNGKQGDGHSYASSISSDGRFVAFDSEATNLVNSDTNDASDVFVHDRETGKTERVSVRTNGVQGDGGSYSPSISSDGRYVAFQSSATNLVNKDTNGCDDIFVHDRQTGETRRVSIRTNGVQGDKSSNNPSISSDGRYVAFDSFASNFVNKDTNGVCDVFVHERETGKTTRVSVRTNGKQGDENSCNPSISSDGRSVAFYSHASNFVNKDTNGCDDIFVHERETGKTTRVSVRTNGIQSDGNSWDASISSDGRSVAFYSNANNLVNGDTNNVPDVFVHDREKGETRRVSVRTNGKQGDGSSENPSISSNGRYVGFSSFATNLVNKDTNGVDDIFVHDRQTGETRRVSVRTNGKQGDGESYAPSISSDGRYAAFYSYASNLVNGDTNGAADVFVTELAP